MGNNVHPLPIPHVPVFVGVSKVLWFGGFRGLLLDLFGSLKVVVKNGFSTLRFHACTG